MDDFYTARGNTMSPLPWPSIAPPFTPLGGLDIVEVSPPLDPSERTEFLAAEMLFRILRRFRTQPVTGI